MIKTLVTGGTGFLGRTALGSLLAREYDVHIVSREPQRIKGVTCHQADLLDESSTQSLIAALKPVYLLHMAWNVEHGRFWASEENYLWLKASKFLFEAFAENGGRRIAAAGTCAEYDWSGNESVLSEASPIAPSTVYGRAKNELHEYLKTLTASHAVSYAWGRIFFPYGPGESFDRFVPSIAIPLLAGDRAVCRSGQLFRDLTYVEDVGNAFAALLNSRASGPVNVASGAPVSLAEAAKLIADLLDAEDRLEIEYAEQEPVSLAADIRKLRDETDFSPSTGLREGLNKAIRWWQVINESNN